MRLEPGTIGRIADVVDDAGAEVSAIYPIGKPEPARGDEPDLKKVIVRFHAGAIAPVVAALEDAGFKVIESVDAVPHPERAAA
jgi:acetoin utilization protein AcuB